MHVAVMKKLKETNPLQDRDILYRTNQDVIEWMENDEMARRSTIRRRFKLYRYQLEVGLLLIIVGLLVERCIRHTPQAFELAGDTTGFAPKFSKQVVSFRPNPIFAPEDPAKFWSKETQEAWLDIVPEGLGYVNVEHPSQYSNLPQPIHDYANHTVYATSVTHQLQCLYSIVEAYNFQRLIIDSKLSKSTTVPWAINRCFDYLRQAIVCAGDVALEGAETTSKPPHRGGSDGWDAKHVCRDYGQVMDYLQRETVNHVKWISSVVNA